MAFPFSNIPRPPTGLFCTTSAKIELNARRSVVTVDNRFVLTTQLTCANENR